MRKNLTAKSIDSLPPASGKRYEVRDTLLTGLLLRVSSTGNKVWYVSTRISGRAHRIKVGSYPIVPLAEAREKARSLLCDVQLGRYSEPEPEIPTAAAFKAVAKQFIEVYAKPRNRGWKSTERVLTKFSALDAMPIDTIRRTDVVRILDGLIASGLAAGTNRALAAIKKLFAWCVDRGTIQVNPVAALKAPAKEVSRDRVLTDDEVVACWKAGEQEGFPFAQFAQLLVLTGQRRGEVAGMCWSEINFDNAVWTIPAERSKNATRHTVPLAPLAILLLQLVPRFLGSPYVFTTTGKTPISGFGRLKVRMDESVGATDWRLHDLRRTVATNMAVMGVQPHIIEAVLNHKSGIVSGVAAVYNRHAYSDEKREALERWAIRVSEIVELRSIDCRAEKENAASLC